MKVRQFFVLPKLPEKLQGLQELSQNLWYSWNWELVKLFIRLDSEMWETCHQNPVETLARVPQETLQRAAEDDGFLASLNRVHTKYQDYLNRKKWFQYNFNDYNNHKVAYFSLEYGLDTSLPVYSGGLGILSGDTLKSASDMGIPMVAVGLLYRYGYFRQFLSTDGWQQERYEENDWYHMPVQLVKDENNEPIKVTVELDAAPVKVQILKVNIGQIPLYLLDTNIPENSSKCREITSVLYGGDKDMRIRQEIILGIGGIKALRAMKIEPSVYHINEGHSWFLTLERIRFLMHERGLSFKQASQYIWSTAVFTTHTPVPAGNEKFEPILVRRYLDKFIKQLGISWEEFISIGKVFPKDKDELFCMTVAALKYSAFSNGVSKLHGKISREMWHNIWPELPSEEIPIKAITNGVHSSSWISHDMHELFVSYFGSKYEEFSGLPEIWEKVYKIPDAELWRVHNRRRERLVFFARKKLKQQMLRRGVSQYGVQKAEQILDPQILTIGFARRFSTYKRGALLFSDLDRLDKIVNNPNRPIQIILSGKAHPLDNPGKEIIRQIIDFAADERFRDRILFLEDYDIDIARYLVQGVDVWLNTPRRPQEASGTSGMKAAMNGALNLSILDGWWCEGYNDKTGFKIGNGEDYYNVEQQDIMDAEMLYNSLEREVIPTFYSLNEIGLPVQWIEKMKASIHMAGEKFSAQRMIMDYTKQFYIPAIDTCTKLQENNYDLTKNLTDWLDKMASSWDKIDVTSVDVPNPGATLFVGEQMDITVKVFLGKITPDDIKVELVSGKLDSQERILDYDPIEAELIDDDSNQDNVFTFRGKVISNESGRFGITARIIPKSNVLPHTLKPKLITWW
ncbi:MAG: alpha-glucan phosphorylase [Candidatus Zixiibacteriota bacterium]|nr:MAG: alpha-glucan phosphorylase [candidate division Zixibacteria bacterium]